MATQEASTVPRIVQSPHIKPIKSILRNSVSARNYRVQEIDVWTAESVFKYFVGQNFSIEDAMVLKEQEIDGEVLLNMQREDLLKLKLKVGVLFKMWNHILLLRAGKTRKLI